MSEAETLTAVQGFIGLTNQLFFGYISLMSGFLIMSCLVANKISIFLSAVAVALFSVVSALLLLGIFLSRNKAEGLLKHLRPQAQRGELDLV